VVNDLDVAAADAVAAEVGGIAIGSDAASEDGVTALVDGALAELGRIDIWFGNAGIDRGLGLEASESEWTASWDVNVMAHVRAARLLIPSWIEQGGGRYVMTASAAGLLTMLDSPAYSVTKHGAVGFAEWLSATYRHRGIVVQAICPQGVDTRMYQDSGPLKDVLSRDALLTPDEVAEEAWKALDTERFLVLPHPQVQEYYTARAGDTDRWLTGMNRVQQHLEQRTEQG
jgi:NAD(P)-dependent dehydrogenase (short-subunit alcohol dehydrogenase family)